MSKVSPWHARNCPLKNVTPRIENIRKKRERKGSREMILRGISSLGLEWDELYSQTDNLVDYQDSINFLTEKGLTYNCACSRKNLPKGAYPGTCREINLPPDQNRSIRVKTPDKKISFSDLIFGKIEGNVFLESGDFVIKPRDEAAAYQLAVVIDDAKSEITEVVRGADLVRSSLLQLHLYKELQLTPPVFMHIPVVKNSRNIKLSKIETAITNKKLVLTGTFNEFSRAELKSICERHGAKVLTALSNNVDFLVVGQSPGSKVKKADEFGVKQIFEEEFKALIDYNL